MQAIQGSFGKHYLIALWNLKMKVLSTEKFKCLICVSVAGEKSAICDRKICKARAFKYADGLPGEYRAT